MIEAEQNLLMMKGIIADLPEADRGEVTICAEKLRVTVREHEPHGSIALALVSLEFAAK